MSYAQTADRPSQSVVVTKALMIAANQLGMTNVAIAKTIGVSPATATRMSVGTYTLDPGTKPYELALLLIRLFRSLDSVVGGDAASLASWMKSPNLGLNGIPRELVQSVTGLVGAVEYVDAARARI